MTNNTELLEGLDKPGAYKGRYDKEAAKAIRELQEQVKEYDKALEILQQTLLEVAHAQQCGAEWYTKGSQGLYSQVSMWVSRGQDAINRIKTMGVEE